VTWQAQHWLGALTVPMTTFSQRYTHGHAEPVLRSHRWRTAENSAAYLLPRLAPDAAVLDIGSGPGTITLDLASRVTSGHVIGIDQAPEAVQAAQRAAREQDAVQVEFRVGDVYALDFPADTFDVVHAHQVLQHLSDPVAALRQMRRVCKPGGLVAARDADYSAMTWYPSSSGLTQWLDLYRQLARSNAAEPDAGRRLRSWALEAGFEDVTSSASVWCFADDTDVAWWSSTWAERVTQSSFADQAKAGGFADEDELERLAKAWRTWGTASDAWFAVVHGEILCTG
jgi:ubiquinone/menaquinone biosynthesis C-methylase UbiE